MKYRTQKTNIILLKNEIENLALYTPEELARLLEVDAIITGSFATDKPISDGASLALGLVVEFWGTTNAVNGELLWYYNKRVGGGLGSSTDMLINTLMRKASRRLAYTN